MPGFFGLIEPDIGKLKEFAFNLTDFGETARETAYFDHAYFTDSHFRRFYRDHCFGQSGAYFVCLTGTFLNRKELLLQYQCEDNAELLGLLYHQFSTGFVKHLRGDFAGFIYNASERSLCLFTSFFNEKPVFYLADRQRDRLLFCTSFHDAVNGARKIGQNLTISEKACYYMLTFGHMLEDETLFNEIRKMPPASVLTFKDNTITFDQYYSLNDLEPVSMSRRELIDNLDHRFSSAIKAEYDKDIEHGLHHLATLSGGLDSRMNVLYAKKMGYADIHTFTFSQTGYLDDTISRRIADDNDFERTFISLDPGDFLKDFRRPVIANGGLASYYNGAAALYSTNFLNMNEFGLIHTGQLGDAILGTYLDGPKHTEPSENHVSGMAVSKELYPKISGTVIDNIVKKYKTAELLKFYERGVNYIFNGNIMFHQYAEQASPFMHPDFIDFVLSIPAEIRDREFLYIDWMAIKLNEASKYPWEKFKIRPIPLYFNPLTYILPKIKKASFVALHRYGILPRYHMNPFEYWSSTNKSLTDTLDQFINDHLYLVEKQPELTNDVKALINIQKFAVKGLIVTLLASLENYSD